jgi:hypothetical protein
MKIDGLPVIDVDESEKITAAVRADDLLEGDTTNPKQHPIAIALRRQDDVDDARVTKNETLVRRGKKWFRYDAPIILIVDDPPRFREGLFGSGERRCRCEPEPVLVVYRGNDTGLARQIETVEMVGLGLEDHGPRPHAQRRTIAHGTLTKRLAFLAT